MTDLWSLRGADPSSLLLSSAEAATKMRRVAGQRAARGKFRGGGAGQLALDSVASNTVMITGVQFLRTVQYSTVDRNYYRHCTCERFVGDSMIDL